MAIVFCAWLSTFTRNGLEIGVCQHCRHEVLTFRRRVCPASN
jgi:hypothetical protein